MKTVKDACELQPNALSIKLSDQIEQLDELITAEGDGKTFFEKTHITQGMRDLISEGLARLAGTSSQAVFHLKQAMGGGKTHLLVGFGLLARHPELRKAYCGGISQASAFASAEIAAFNGRNNPDHFFWGEIAYQLGKGDRFSTFWTSGPKAPDEKDWLKLFEGDQPVLILLDEMPPYFHYLDTQKVGNGTVADIATRAFANLLTAAGKKKNVCVVVSDLSAAYRTGANLIHRALEDARSELGRQERNITPVDLAANEIYNILRKRLGTLKTTRDDLAWEIQEEVEEQVNALTGLNQAAKGLYRDENVFEDADIQMAGYAAALRVLTRYAVIDGRDMTVEAIRPRVKGETTFVDGLIAFAVDTANQCLVPQGIPKSHWDKLSGAERFYLKMIDLEARGVKTLDNYQNFAKAFKVRDFQAFMASRKANNARLKSAVEFGRTEMGESSEMHQSVLRAVLYAIMELVKNMDGHEVQAHLTLNIPNYYSDMTQRDMAIELADYLAKHLEELRPEEAGAARVLRELIKNQRLG